MSNASIVTRMREVVEALKRHKLTRTQAEGALEDHAKALECMPDLLRRELASLTSELVGSDWEDDIEFPVVQTQAIIDRIENWLDRVPA